MMLKHLIFRHAKRFFTCKQCGRSSSTLSNRSERLEILNSDDFRSFLQNNETMIESINREFALPYVDINSVLYNTEAVDKGGSLYDLCRGGSMLPPAIDINYIMTHAEEVDQNIKNRKTEFVDVSEVIGAYKRVQEIDEELTKRRENLECKNEVAASEFFVFILSELRKEVEKFYLTRALTIPNKTKPGVVVNGTRGELVRESVGLKPTFDFEVVDHIVIAQRFKGLRQKNFSKMIDKRNYFLIGGLAELEQALVHYTIDKLKKRGFTFVSVPNMLREAVFEGAGLVTNKMDVMVFNIENTSDRDYALAGTSELGLCAYFANHALNVKDLPMKVCSVSTCYRRETGTRLDKNGLFRVKQFLKVEMFGVTANETGGESEELFQEFVDIQKESFEELGLHFDVVNMPTNELGLPAYQKIDIEAWFPGRNKYDEISSASNCTDFQSRRFHILYKDEQKYRFAHTVNATACAVPRLIVALLENGQRWNHEVDLPACLHPYMNGKTTLRKEFFRAPEYVGRRVNKRKRELIQNSLNEVESSYDN